MVIRINAASTSPPNSRRPSPREPDGRGQDRHEHDENSVMREP